MTVWPKSLLTLGTNVLTAQTAARLRRRRAAIGAQRVAFETLNRRLATTSFWREAGIEPGAGYEKFRTRVVLRRHEHLAPAIERMQCGETNVLWPGRCVFFAATSGTSTGVARLLPVTAEMLTHFRGASGDALLYYTARVGHAGVFRGRHLYLGNSTALRPLASGSPEQAYATELDGILALNFSRSAERHLCEPGAAIAEMPEGPAKYDAIATRVATRDISLAAATPSSGLHFARAMQERIAVGKNRLPHLQGLWPNFECFVHSGLSIAPWQEELRRFFGPTIKFHEVYSACEGFVAAQDSESSAGLRLMADRGIFFEFLPMADFDEGRLAQLGPKAVPLADVKIGVDYAVLVTTPGGLARYLLGDVVRFVSLEPPRLVHVGRTDLLLGSFGERVLEKDLTDALLAVCQRHNWSIVNFHVSPHAPAPFGGQPRRQHEWWIELRPGTVRTPVGPAMALEIDAELHRLNADYAARRKGSRLDAPTVRLVMPGIFEHWQRYSRRWGGKSKVPRCRTDRLVAEELLQMTNFAPD